MGYDFCFEVLYSNVINAEQINIWKLQDKRLLVINSYKYYTNNYFTFNLNHAALKSHLWENFPHGSKVFRIYY